MKPTTRDRTRRALCQKRGASPGSSVALVAALVFGTASQLAVADETEEARPNAVTASALAALPDDGADHGHDAAETAEPSHGERSAAGPSTTGWTAAARSRWSTDADLSGGSYRLGAHRGSLDLGLSFASTAPSARALDFRAEHAGPIVPTLPSLSLGLRRASGSAPSASSLLERATGADSGNAYVSRIGLEWKPAQPQVNFLREGLGIRLDNNDRMSLRLRKGVLGVYMQRKF
jgi:hypothetical protein